MKKSHRQDKSNTQFVVNLNFGTSSKISFMNLRSRSTFLLFMIFSQRFCFSFSRSARLFSIVLLALRGEVVRVRLFAGPKLKGSSCCSPPFSCISRCGRCWGPKGDPITDVIPFVSHNQSDIHTFTLACILRRHTLKAWFRCRRHIF